MASFVNNCVFNATSTGTGDFVVASAVAGSQTPASANATNAAIYRYYARSSDSSQWEVGYGAYTSGSVTLARTTVLYNSSGTTGKINFSTVPIVALVALMEDLVFINPPQGRLTLQAATPVMATTQSAKTTIYYTPYVGNQIPIYDGTSFRNVAFSEFSIVTTDTTKSPAAIGASKVNDWFVWDDAGTTRLIHGPDWTSDTARSAGTALTRVNGIWLNNAGITNGPAASRGTYVGTTRSNASSQLDWILGGAASGGTAAFLWVWNAYNRVGTVGRSQDSGSSYTYTGGARLARASSGNQVNIVVGLQEESVNIAYAGRGVLVAATGTALGWGYGIDSTSTFDIANFAASNPQGTNTMVQGGSSVGNVSLAIGNHFIAATEFSDGVNANTYNQTSQNTLSVSTRM